MSDAAGGAVRVGRIEFVNCFPLYLHFAEEMAARGFEAEIVAGTPADLNDSLAGGRIDVTLSSSIEYARHAAGQVLLPGVSISSFGAVDSIRLFGRVPREKLCNVALSEKSATSVTLLKILCREWGIAPALAPRRGPLSEVLQEHDGLLLIGDEALHVLRMGVYPYSCDLGEEWRLLTGKPMVYAVCAARREFAERGDGAAAAVAAALMASRDRCAAEPAVTAGAAAQLYDFSAAYLERYFDQLKFGFTDDYRGGLAEFYLRAAAIGELESVPDLDTVSGQDSALGVDPAPRSDATPGSASAGTSPPATRGG